MRPESIFALLRSSFRGAFARCACGIGVIGAAASAAASEPQELICRAPVLERGPSSAVTPNGVTVLQADPGFATATLKAQGYSVHSYRDVTQGDPWSDPSPSLRDLVFQQAGVSSLVGSWDQLDKDRLFLRAQSYPLARLQSKYGRIPPARLQSLQRVIATRKAAMKTGDAR